MELKKITLILQVLEADFARCSVTSEAKNLLPFFNSRFPRCGGEGLGEKRSRIMVKGRNKDFFGVANFRSEEALG